jgi:3-oxoacyl-[acyl-carrier-protein] synthase-3
MNAYITGVASFLPNKPVPNEQIESLLGKVQGASSPVRDLILHRNGIRWRYYALDPTTRRPTHTNAELTAEAIRQLMKTAGVDLTKIDLLACGTSSPDQAIPNHAAMVHGVLKFPPCELVSTAGVCCSGMTAMKYAYTSLLAGASKRAVVTGSELASTALTANHFSRDGPVDSGNEFIGFSQDFLRFMLSDGAGAVLLETEPNGHSPSLRIDWLEILSFANELDACMYSAAIKQADGSLRGWRTETGGVAEAARKGYFALSQDVTLLGENIIRTAARFFKTIAEKHSLNVSEIDWLLPHLSSMFFQEPLVEEMVKQGLTIPIQKWFTNLKYKGNTGSASIFIMLEELVKSGKIKSGHRIVCVVPESARFTFACAHLTAV